MKTSAVIALASLLCVAVVTQDITVGIAGVLKCGNEYAPAGTEVWVFDRKAGSDSVLSEQTLAASGHFNVSGTKDGLDTVVLKINHKCNNSACTRQLSVNVDEKCHARGGQANRWCALDVSTGGTHTVVKVALDGKNGSGFDLGPGWPGEVCAAPRLSVLAPLVACAVALTLMRT